MGHFLQCGSYSGKTDLIPVFLKERGLNFPLFNWLALSSLKHSGTTVPACDELLSKKNRKFSSCHLLFVMIYCNFVIWKHFLCFWRLLAARGILFSGCTCVPVSMHAKSLLTYCLIKRLMGISPIYNLRAVGTRMNWLDFDIKRS